MTAPAEAQPMRVRSIRQFGLTATEIAMGDKTRGLYNKFEVHRVDGSSAPGGKHHGCEYFVLDAPHVCEAGLRFRPEKTRASTRAAVLIRWTSRLRDAVDRVRKLQAERLLKRRADQRVVSGFLFTGQDGTQLTYWGARSAWNRAAKRAGVKDARIHDMRAKALTDKDQAEGIGAARTMGAHSTETQTADYIRGRKPRETGATR